MSNIAVIELAGAQYVVEPGSKIELNKLKQYEVDKAFKLTPVMSTKGEDVLFNSGDVEAKVLENKKGKKLYVIKFKAKSRYRRRTGHRQHLSVLEILSINGQKVSISKEKEVKSSKESKDSKNGEAGIKKTENEVKKVKKEGASKKTLVSTSKAEKSNEVKEKKTSKPAKHVSKEEKQTSKKKDK